MTTPTAAEIAAMPNRELDCLLAELMGWQWVKDGLGSPPRAGLRVPILYYSTDHVAAAEAIAFVLAHESTIEFECHAYVREPVWTAAFVLDGAYIETDTVLSEPRAKAEAAALALIAIKNQAQ